MNKNITKITFQDNGFIFKAISFDNKNMILYTNRFDKDNNFINKVEFRMGQIPKKIKKLLNPI